MEDQATATTSAPLRSYDEHGQFPNMPHALRRSIYEAVSRERDYQDKKYGANRPHELPGWMLIMRKELIEAEDAWMKGTHEECLCEMLQVVAVGIAALEQYGVVERDAL